MLKYIIKRVLIAAVSMVLLITITFFLMHAVPGSPFSAGDQKNLNPEVREAIEAHYGLNLPVYEQYFNYMTDLLHGDLGMSMKKTNYTVNELISSSFPASAQIGLWAIVVSLFIGIPLGVIAALKRGGIADMASMTLATIGISIPTFVIAMLLMYVFCMEFSILPSHGWGQAVNYILPVVCLCMSPIANITRLTRSSMMEVVQQDYIRTARSKGLPEFTVIGKHGMRNAVVPVVTYLGPLVANLTTGSFAIERIFMVPGIGRYFVNSVSDRDYTMIMGMTIFFGIFIMICTLIVDIAYALIDPRVRYEE